MIISMYNVDIPTHQMHLQVGDSWVGTVIWKDEFNCIAISSPHKVLAKEHVAALFMAKSQENPSPRWEWSQTSFLRQCLAPNAAGRITALESLVIKLKSKPEQYESIAVVKAAAKNVAKPFWQESWP